MVNYRRNYDEGGCYFFTVTLKNRALNLLTENIDLLRSSMKQVQKEHFYETKAIVVLPEHLHCIWQLPDNDSNYPMRWQKIKRIFSQKIITKGINIQRNIRGEYMVWQRRYWEHTIRNETDFENHVNYIHYNPVKHKYVKCASDWPYSSFHHYVKQGMLPANWGSHIKENVREEWGE